MDEPTRDRIVERLYGNPELVGVPFEVTEDDDGLHLVLDGVNLATVPAEPEARASARAELQQRYGISLPEPAAIDDATPEDLEKWLFYAAGFKDSIEPITDWETRRYEARLPHLETIIRDRVRQRLGSPFTGYPAAGDALVETLDIGIERVTSPRESSWSGVPVELESDAYVVEIDVDLSGVDDELLFFRVDDQLNPLTDDGLADAERMVPPRCIVLVADALTVRWDEDSIAETASRVEAWLDHAGEAVVGPALDRPQPGERTFVEAMASVSDRIGMPHEFAVAWREAYVLREEAP